MLSTITPKSIITYCSSTRQGSLPLLWLHIVTKESNSNSYPLYLLSPFPLYSPPNPCSFYFFTLYHNYHSLVLFNAPQIPAEMHPFHWIPQDSARFQWNGTGILWNGPGFHQTLTERTFISACEYKCVYMKEWKDLCSLSVSLSLLRYALPFWAKFPMIQ